MKGIPRVLTVAGSDSGGCAGIQADLKTFTALAVHGMSAVTSVTAQNTVGVLAVSHVAPEHVARQIEAVADDIGVDAAKTGMLPTAEIVRAVAREFRRWGISKLVVDPVMVSTSGERLIDSEALKALQTELFPMATAVTPNLAEAEALTGLKLDSQDRIREAASKILEFGPISVIIKGGHGDSPTSADLLFDGSKFSVLEAPRLQTRNTHGGGCTFAAAMAAFLAQGFDLPESASRAKAYVTRAIAASLSLGKGRGPLGHFFQLRPASHDTEATSASEP